MDAFYASVEQRDDPAAARAPGHRRRSRPPWRRAGGLVRGPPVRRAERDADGARAAALRPTPWWCAPRFDVYADVSSRVFDILQTVTPLYEPLSLDEAFLDVTASRSLFGAPAEIARAAAAPHRRRAGAAGLGRDRGVQAGRQDRLRPGQAERSARGAGRRRRRFSGAAAGGAAAGHRPQEREDLRRDGDRHRRRSGGARGWRSSSSGSGRGGRDLWERAQAIDPRPVIADRDAKSVGAEETFDEDLDRRRGAAPARPRPGAAGGAPAAARRACARAPCSSSSNAATSRSSPAA